MEEKTKLSYRRRGIYLLPNLFTTAALFAGFYAIVAAMNLRFDHAAIAIFVAMVLDGVDGRVARMTNTQSDFGAQYDSLSDMVSFGLAPALVMYKWSLASMVSMGWQWGKIGWITAFVYTACAAMRLARFNTQLGGVADKNYFQGLPSPSAAAVVAGLVWVGVDNRWEGSMVSIPAMLLTLTAGLMMVSNVFYYSFKEVNYRSPVPFLTILIIVLALALGSINAPLLLFVIFLGYLGSGPVFAVVRRVRKQRKGTPDA